MRIIYIHQYFITPRQQGGTRSYEFARYLVKNGHEVVMVTSGRLNNEFPCAKGKIYTEYTVDGIRVLSIAAGYNDARAGTSIGGWLRMLSFFHFANTATRVCKTLGRPDVVFATHTPLTVGITGMALKRYFKCPFVFEVRDLWPEALVNIGALKNGLVIAWMRSLASKIYRKADHISAASPGMKEGVVKYGIDPLKVTVITNASDIDLFHPGNDGKQERQRLQIGDRFAAIYFGAMGAANGLEYVVEAAKVLSEKGDREIVFVLHGDGSQKGKLKQLVETYKLVNVIFSIPVPEKTRLARIVAGCDVCLTIYNAGKETTWSPNKMFDALAAGKPVIVNVPGWLGETIVNNNCGFSTDPLKPLELAEALQKLNKDNHLYDEMSHNARLLAEREFSRESQAKKLEDVLQSVVKGK